MKINEAKIGDKVVFILDKYKTKLSYYLVEGQIYTIMMSLTKEILVEGYGVTQVEHVEHFVSVKGLRGKKLNKLNNLNK